LFVLLAGCQDVVATGPDAPAPYAWYRADNVERHKEHRISVLQDQSGNHRDLLAPADTIGPLLINNAVHGQPVLRFDGDSRLVSPPEQFGVLEGPKTVFVVALVRNADEGYLYDGAVQSGRNTLHTGNGIYRGTWDVNSGALHGTTIGPAVINDNWFVHGVIYDEHQNRHFINGTQVSAGDFDVHPLAGLTLGSRFTGTHGIEADIAELIVYPGVLDDLRRRAIETRLSKLYGISLDGGRD
jgi:hypothetical protein